MKVIALLLLLTPAPAELTRHPWRMTDQPSPAPEMRFTAGDPPRVSGFAGCNQFSANYELTEGGRLTFGAVVLTRMACEDAAMRREQQFLDLLRRVNGYRFDGPELLLLENGWEAARFAAAP